MGKPLLRCAVIDDYQAVASRLASWDMLAGEAEIDFFHDHVAGSRAVAQRLHPYDIVVAMRERTPFPPELLHALPNLKLLVTTGMRNASIDVAAARKRGVVVCGTQGTGQPTAELAWALILALARRLPTEIANVSSGGWQRTVGADLYGATLGLLGLGTVGGQMAAIARAFGMEVAAWSANLTPERCAAFSARRAGSLQELLEQADFVTIHLGLGDRTRGLIGRAQLQMMKSTAFLINTSRAEIVHQGALVEALSEGRIAGAAVDVYDQEPPPPDHPLRSAPNLVTTPHLGYVTEGNLRSHYGMAVEDIAAWLRGQPIRVVPD